MLSGTAGSFSLKINLAFRDSRIIYSKFVVYGCKSFNTMLTQRMNKSVTDSSELQLGAATPLMLDRCDFVMLAVC